MGNTGGNQRAEEKGQWIVIPTWISYHLIDEEFGTIWKDTTSNM